MLGGKNRQHGYTIIEVMIFMAISSLMFLMAAGFINGKQASVQFKQSMQDINGVLQATMNEVANGEYPPLGNNTCTASSVTNSAPNITSGAKAQGSNVGCILLGKVMQFHLNTAATDDADDTNYAVYSIAARQTNVTTKDAIDNFTNASPMVIDDKSSSNAATVNITKKPVTGYGLSFTDALLCNADCTVSATKIGAFGFFGNFGGYNSAKVTNTSTAQDIIIAAVPNTYNAAFLDEAGMADKLNSNLSTITSNEIVSGGKFIVLCFRYGPRYGSVTIGGPNGQNNVTTVNMGKSPGC